MVRMMEKMSFTTSGASPSDGSSIISSFGLLISARPTASICCSPPDSVPAICQARSFRRGKRAYMRWMSASTSRSLRRYAPIFRFSSTVMSGKISRPSGTRIRPFCTMYLLGLPVMSSPL